MSSGLKEVKFCLTVRRNCKCFFRHIDTFEVFHSVYSSEFAGFALDHE